MSRFIVAGDEVRHTDGHNRYAPEEHTISPSEVTDAETDITYVLRDAIESVGRRYAIALTRNDEDIPLPIYIMPEGTVKGQAIMIVDLAKVQASDDSVQDLVMHAITIRANQTHSLDLGKGLRNGIDLRRGGLF